LRQYLPNDGLEGGTFAPADNRFVLQRSRVRNVKRLIAAHGFLNSKAALEQAAAKSDLVFSRPLQQTSVFLHQHRVMLGAKLQKKLKDEVLKKNARFQTVIRRRYRPVQLHSSPLGFLRRRVNKLTGI